MPQDKDLFIRKTYILGIIQEKLPLDQQWSQIDPSGLTMASEALIAKHLEFNSSSLSSENQRGMLYTQ